LADLTSEFATQITLELVVLADADAQRMAREERAGDRDAQFGARWFCLGWLWLGEFRGGGGGV
jgi:hypothetical protein